MTSNRAMQAYQVWRDTDHQALIIANNDVLVPDGAVTSLLAAMVPAGRM